MSILDPRRHAIRPDLADIALAGKVEDRTFVTPRRMRIIDPLAGVHKAPSFDSMQLTQGLMGETAKVFSEEGGWSWVQLERDGYVGYVNANSLRAETAELTHRIAVPATFLYAEPNLKSQPAIAVTLNAQVTVTGGDEKFSHVSNGRFVFAAHLKPAGTPDTDYVAVAERFLHVPYYWGGKSVHGLDCSGLVQLAMQSCGITCPRDSDMQEAAFGKAVLVNGLDNLRRGDLVFWDGHVGIMRDGATLLHANGHHMMVVAEPLKEAVDRIAQRYGQITSIKRL